MGCQTSKQENNDIISVETEEQFRLSYRQLVSQDRGQIFQLYHFSTIISRSAYSIVRKVTSRASEINRICKIVPLLNKKYFKVISQVQFLKKLDHPNIIQVIQYFLEPNFLYIVMEEAPGTRILTELNKLKNGIQFQQLVQIIKQLLQAVDFCHRKMIAHRTITTQNIILYWGDKTKILKLIDFSQACTIDCPNNLKIMDQKRNIIIPENQLQFPDKIDIFDCAIVFLSLLTGKKMIFRDAIDFKLILQQANKAVKKIQINKKVQNDLIQLLNKMLSEDPKLRPTALQCLNHKFFAQFNSKICSRKALQCMMQFQPQTDLHYFLRMYASLNMTSTMDKAQYLAQFYNLDKNKDGQISFQQLTQGIMNTFNFEQQKAKSHAQSIFNQLDKNKSGSINFSQFITGTVKLVNIISNNILQKMFNQIDTNKDGYISQDQINNLTVGLNKLTLNLNKKQIKFNQFKEIMSKLKN